MSHSAAQLRTAELTAKCTGGLSIVGSSAILYDILVLGGKRQRGRRSHKKQRRKKRDRGSRMSMLSQLLVGMSFFDIGASSMYIVGSWAIPRDHGEDNPNIFQPSGTDQTCRTQAFLFQTFASAIPMYNLSLALYSFLAVNRQWKEETFQARRWRFHVLPACFGTITATYGLLHDQFNPNELWCWFSGTEQSDMLKFVVYYGPLWVVFWTIVILFALMYRHVREIEQELAQNKDSTVNTNSTNGSSPPGMTPQDEYGNSDEQYPEKKESYERTSRATPPGCSSSFVSSSSEIDEGPMSNDLSDHKRHDYDSNSEEIGIDSTDSSEEFKPRIPPKSMMHSHESTTPKDELDMSLSKNKQASDGIHPQLMRLSQIPSPRNPPHKSKKSKSFTSRQTVGLRRAVFVQGIQFACVFILTFLFPTITRSQQLHKETVRFPVLFFMTLFLPLQGFLNSLVYFRKELQYYLCQAPRHHLYGYRHSKEGANAGVLSCVWFYVWGCITSCFVACRCRSKENENDLARAAYHRRRRCLAAGAAGGGGRVMVSPRPTTSDVSPSSVVGVRSADRYYDESGAASTKSRGGGGMYSRVTSTALSARVSSFQELDLVLEEDEEEGGEKEQRPNNETTQSDENQTKSTESSATTIRRVHELDALATWHETESEPESRKEETEEEINDGQPYAKQDDEDQMGPLPTITATESENKTNDDISNDTLSPAMDDRDQNQESEAGETGS